MLSKRLKDLRERKQVLQKEVANYIGVTERVYGYYESGRFPKDETILKKLADYFDCTSDYLLGITNSPETKVLTELPKELIDAGIKGIEVFKDIKPSDLTLEDYKDILEAYAKINSRHA